MKKALATIAVVGTVALVAVLGLSQVKNQNLAQVSTPFSEEEREFINFIAKHRKNYFSKEEYNYRLDIFAKNFKLINEHNAKNDATFSMIVNHFADLTPYEFKRDYTGYNAALYKPQANEVHEYSGELLADTINWVTKGDVSGVKNQGSCGSCWAFSTTGAVESVTKIRTGKLPLLSEQQLVDCSRSYGNQGCNGGLMDSAFRYVQAHGLTTESAYPYTGRDGTCRTNSGAYKVSGYRDVYRSANSLKSALQKNPVSIAIEADQYSFQYYHRGVLTTGCGRNLDHGVLAVGYGTESGTPYWLVKNSWGPSWGDKGYIKIGINGDVCGVIDQASYPVA